MKKFVGDEVSSTSYGINRSNILTRNSYFSSVTFGEEGDNPEGDW